MENKPSRNRKPIRNAKQEQLDQYRIQNAGKAMTTNEGRKISNDQDQVKVGPRGPSLREDRDYREKMTHFVKEEIPERNVHPRRYGAHGDSEWNKSVKHVSRAYLLLET